jgi:predicted membrane channel-forming protein YqfA (hemolysin III family)
MLMVAIAWMYVVVMMALAEAFSPQGSVLGAVVTLVFYGLLPLAIVLYIMATPERKRRLKAREAKDVHEAQEGLSATAVAAPGSVSSSAPSSAPGSALKPDGSGHAARAAVAPERKEA